MAGRLRPMGIRNRKHRLVAGAVLRRRRGRGRRREGQLGRHHPRKDGLVAASAGAWHGRDTREGIACVLRANQYLLQLGRGCATGWVVGGSRRRPRQVAGHTMLLVGGTRVRCRCATCGFASLMIGRQRRRRRAVGGRGVPATPQQKRRRHQHHTADKRHHGEPGERPAGDSRSVMPTQRHGRGQRRHGVE